VQSTVGGGLVEPADELAVALADRGRIADALRGRPLTKTHRRNISRGVHRHLYEKETRTA
jgi:hypothetical protein